MDTEKIDILDQICDWEEGDKNRTLTGMDWYRAAVDMLRDAYVVIEKDRAELARVKAESLRVVPDGEALSADAAQGNFNFVMHDGEVLFPEPHLWDWMTASGEKPKFYDPRTPVQPVRLERWEKD